ncbi:MAG: LLM class flavin-dependent oxidoreductase [Acidimicrobiales bacterium]
MRVGITLPHFEPTPRPALEAARQAEDLGLDGVFCFDHLWPMGQPGRPALAPLPLLAAVAATTSKVAVGTLVSRVGLVEDDVLVASLRSLDRIATGRCIAGIGTGDTLSRAENEAFGLPFEPAARRRQRMAAVAAALLDAGTTVWLGGGAAPVAALGRLLSVPLNLWGADAADVEAARSRGNSVTWGGVVPTDVGAAAEHFARLAAAGADWVVCAWPPSLKVVARAARSTRE